MDVIARIVFAAALCVGVAVVAAPGREKGHRTDWMRDAGWGVFNHYLVDAKLTAEAWQRQVDAFDVPDTLAASSIEMLIVVPPLRRDGSKRPRETLRFGSLRRGGKRGSRPGGAISFP